MTIINPVINYSVELSNDDRDAIETVYRLINNLVEEMNNRDCNALYYKNYCDYGRFMRESLFDLADNLYNLMGMEYITED